MPPLRTAPADSTERRMTNLEQTLDPYQREGRDFALANPHGLILDPVRLGTTHQAVAVRDALLAQDARAFVHDAPGSARADSRPISRRPRCSPALSCSPGPAPSMYAVRVRHATTFGPAERMLPLPVLG